MQPILFTSIDRSDRQRIDYGDVSSLAQSLYSSGFIHPLCVNTDVDPPRLIAGGRRSAALDYIFAKTVDELLEEWGQPHITMASLIIRGELEFGIHYTHKSTESEQEHASLELIENVQRHNLSWQEEVLAICKIHRLKVAEAVTHYDTWTQRRTAALLGVNQATVSLAFTLAAELADRSSPTWSASTMTEAFQLIAKRQHDEASKLLVDRIKLRATTVPTIQPSSPVPNSPAFIQTFDPSKFVTGGIAAVNLADEFGPVPTTNPEPTPLSNTISDSNKDQITEAYQTVSKLIHHAKFEDFCAQVPPESFDHALMDPPYAIEMKNIAQGGTGQKDIDRVAGTHDVKSNLNDIPLWLAGCYKILKDKSFCVWFADEEIRPYICAEAVKVGFKVQRWSFIWCKTSPCSNQRAEYNFTKKTEIAIIMRKGDARLVKQQPTNYWVGELTAEDKAAGVNHPFIKPKELWQYLLAAIALPGSTVVDGFSGVGSSTRAMMLAGYTPVGVESEEMHYTQQVQNLTKTYCELNGIKFS